MFWCEEKQTWCSVNGCNKNICEFEKIELTKHLKVLGTIEAVKAAVEKQIAKEPIVKNDDYHLGKNGDIVSCPTCNKRLRIKYKERHCCGCGQKLNWDSYLKMRKEK